MMGKTHIIIGVTFGLGLLPAVSRGDYTTGQFLFTMSGLTIGSLLPDIDHPQSIIARQIPLVGGLVGNLAGHRGFFHSIMGIASIFVLLATLVGFSTDSLSALGIDTGQIPLHFVAGMFVGYFLHIMADMLTVSGVKLFYPVKKNISLGLFTTGGIGEFILRWGLIALCVLQVITVLS